MSVEFFDLLGSDELPEGYSKKVLFSSEHFHTWIHGDYPGHRGPLHRHSADEIFYCVQGQCTFKLPDGRVEKLNPGMMVVIPKDDYYELENTGDEYMILLGCRAETHKKPRFNDLDEVVGKNTMNIPGEESA